MEVRGIKLSPSIIVRQYGARCDGGGSGHLYVATLCCKSQTRGASTRGFSGGAGSGHGGSVAAVRRSSRRHSAPGGRDDSRRTHRTAANGSPVATATAAAADESFIVLTRRRQCAPDTTEDRRKRIICRDGDRHRKRLIQSYSPVGASVHPPSRTQRTADNGSPETRHGVLRAANSHQHTVFA